MATATVQRIIQSAGIRFYKPLGINFAPSNIINRAGPVSASPIISYRSLCSSSSGDSRSNLFNGKRYYFVDTLAMVKGLEAQGIPPKHAEAITSSMIEVLAELEKDPNYRFSLLQSKADSLRKNIKKMRREADKEVIFVQYSDLNLERKVLDNRANRSSAKTAIKNTKQLDEERIMKLETKESEGTFHVFLSLCVATVCASIIGMAAALMILFDQISKT